MTGFTRNMNHIVMGADDQKPIGMYLGFVGIGVVVLSWIVAHYISWRHPRGVQHALKSVTYPMQLLTLNRLLPQQRYTEEEISPYFWPNGKMPLRDDWKHMAESGFDCFRLIWRSLAISHPFQYRYARDRTLRIRSGPKILTFRFADKSGLGSFGDITALQFSPRGLVPGAASGEQTITSGCAVTQALSVSRPSTLVKSLRMALLRATNSDPSS